MIFLLLLGLIFGSFITMASYRLGHEKPWTRRSQCPACETTLGVHDLVPIFSWVFSKGKCRYCHSVISPRYPLIELTTAAWFALIYVTHGLTPIAIILVAMAVALMIMIVVDFEHYIIPDSIHVFLFPLGIAFHYVKDTPWHEAALGCALGAGLGLLLHYGYKWLRKKEGLGFGDVKFFAVAGLWLTLPLFPSFLFLSGVLGVATGLIYRALGKGPYFPFGPALAVALFFCVAFPEFFNIFSALELIHSR